MNFRAIYDENVAFVFRTLRRFGVADAGLPDAAQEVFTVAFRSLDRFEHRSSMRTWLFGIARRVASDLRRSAHARREVLDEGASTHDAGEADTSMWAEVNAEVSRAETLLRSLPEEQQIVFALFEVEEWTGAEIAEAMQTSVATVHSRLRLAREGLQRKLDTAKEGA